MMHRCRHVGVRSARCLATAAPAGPPVTAGTVVGVAFFGSLVAGTFSMGYWQTKRYFWKVDLVEARKAALKAPPKEASAQEAANKPNFERSLVQGEFLGQDVKVGPRAPPPGLLPPKQGMAAGPIGYEIVSVFKAADGTECLVNRGWIPRHLEAEPTTKKDTVLVVAADGEKQGPFSPVNTKKETLWLELPFIAKLLGIHTESPPYFVQVSEGETPKDYFPKPRTSVQFENFSVDPPTHAAYAFTWFSLALFGAIMSKRILFPPASRASVVRHNAALRRAKEQQQKKKLSD